MTETKARRILRFSRFICLLVGWMIRIEARGLYNLPDEGGFVAAGNHLSTADGPVAWLSLLKHGRSRPVVFMATRGVFRIPVLGPILLWMGFVRVHRGDSRTAATGQVALEGAMAAVKEGRILGMYPRGGISTPDNPRRMKSGVARMYEAGLTVVPMVATGADRLIPPGCWFPRFWRKVAVEFHPALPPGLTREEVLTRLDLTLYGA